MSSYSLRPRRDIRQANDVDYVMANLDDLVRSKVAAEGDTEFLQLLDAIEDREIIQDALSSHYTVETTGMRGKKTDRDKMKIRGKHNFHGSTNSLNSLNALMMALESEKHGPIVQRSWKQGESPYDKRIALAAQRALGDDAARQLAGVGLRGSALTAISPQDRLLRATDRLIELSHGYNPVTGSLYAGLPLDGGHRVAHHENPAMSALRENMMFESQYENRVKGARSGEDLQNSIIRSLSKRIKGTAKRDPEVPAVVFAGLRGVNED